MTNESLINGTLSEAVEKLAHVAAEARLRRKEAGIMDSLSGIASDPAVLGGLGGAALGGAAGGLSSFAQPKERRNTLSNMLSGALAGGAAGAGGGLAYKHLIKAPQKAPVGDTPGFTAGGAKYKIKPEAIEQNPELGNQVEQLQSKSLPQKIVGGVNDAATDYAAKHPILAILGIGDAAQHTAGRLADNAAPGGRGGGSMNPNQFRANIEKYLKKPKDTAIDLKDTAKQLEPMRNMGNDELQQILAGGRAGHASPSGADPQLMRNVQSMGGGRRGVGSAMGDLRNLLSKATRGKVTPVDNMWGSGYARSAMGAKPVPGVMGSVNRALEGRGGASLLGKLGPRAALYAGIPALQWYMGQSSQNSQNMEALQKLMEQSATRTQ